MSRLQKFLAGIDPAIPGTDSTVVVELRVNRKDPWNKTNSIALVASNNGHGCILAFNGEGIEVDFEHESDPSLDMHWMDDAPDGLSIWEGCYKDHETWGDHGMDYDGELVGTFRPLTEREWELLKSTGTPWEMETT